MGKKGPEMWNRWTGSWISVSYIEDSSPTIDNKKMKTMSLNIKK